MPALLFVYGTLRSGFDNPHARLLRASAELVGDASVRGAVVPFGAYTGFRPGADGRVSGELWRLLDLAILSALDEYEGPDYARVEIETIDGHTAWIYRLA